MRMKLQLTHALTKIFTARNDPLPALPHLTLLRGEYGCLQLVLTPDRDADVQISADGVPSCQLFTVKEIPAGLAMYPDTTNCTLLESDDGNYPDLLIPTDGAVKVKAGCRTCVFARIDTSSLPCGEQTVTFRVSDGTAETTVSAALRIGSAKLPAQTLIHTNWFHADCLASYYGVPVFSEAHWRIMDRFLANAAAYGVNCILTPLFTPPLDTEVGGERPTVQLADVCKRGDRYTFDFTRLRRYLDMAEAHGIRYFEFSHLFTQWGAAHAPKIVAQTESGTRRIFGWETDARSPEYTDFLRQLG